MNRLQTVAALIANYKLAKKTVSFCNKQTLKVLLAGIYIIKAYKKCLEICCK